MIVVVHLANAKVSTWDTDSYGFSLEEGGKLRVRS